MLLPVIVIVIVVIPLLFFTYRVATRSRAAGEHPATDDAATIARNEQEFADAEAFQEQWRREEKRHQPDTLL
jgi:uncharacterized membrane protein